ncbi:MAG: hypothetical protein HQ503_12800 [Rhodospirillales bacterium]|nr:hypothetical protein [Rhodospirillales bacterium]
MVRPFSLHHILFFCFIGLVSVPSIVLVIWLERSAVDRGLEGAADKHLVLAQSVSFAISRYIKDVKSVVAYAREELEYGADMRKVPQLLGGTNIKYIIRTDKGLNIRRQIVAGKEVPFKKFPLSIRDQLADVFKVARNNPKALNLSSVIHNHENVPALYYICAEDDGGYTIAEVGTEYVVQLQRNMKFGSSGHAAIVDRKGHVIGHPSKEWRDSIRDLSAVTPVKLMQAGKRGISVFHSPAADKMMVAGYLVEPRTGWGIMVPEPLDEVIAAARGDLTGEITIIVIATLLAAIASWWLARYLVTPIQRIADAAASYQRDKILVTVHYQDVSAPRELHVLAEAYNSLVNSTSALQRDLEHRVEQRTAALESEVVERRLVEQKLRDQQAQLAHITRVSTMGEMASGIAHELNQPLAAICAYIDGCLNRLDGDGSAIDPDIVRALEKASQQATRAGNIIRRVRDFVRYGDDEFRTVDINEAVREAADLLQNEAHLYSVTIETEIPNSPSEVFADAIQIQQIVLNFGRNGIDAIQSMPEKSRKLIIRTNSSDDGWIDITVEDAGAGLIPDVADQIFDPFFSTKEDGLGMGLAICRSIAEMHDGRVWYKPAKSGGCVFGLTMNRLEVRSYA